MNKLIEHTASGTVSAAGIADWLLSRGIPLVSTREAAHLLGVKEDHVRQRLAPLRRRGLFATAGRGLWIPVPPDRRTWGAPEPIGYIDAMMQYFDTEYCVGWLSAAAIHGASHQATQTFDVAVSRALRDRTVGRSMLRFRQRSDVTAIPAKRMSLPAGRANVASIEACMLMLASDVELSGGLDNAVTAIVELSESAAFSPELLADASNVFPRSAARRVGWILDKFRESVDTAALHEYCVSFGEVPSVLNPAYPAKGKINKRWSIIENGEVDPDL